MLVEFPDSAEAAFKRLMDLHPGKSGSMVLVRAMSFYHACYELSMEGKTGEEINMMLKHLDEQDERGA